MSTTKTPTSSQRVPRDTRCGPEYPCGNSGDTRRSHAQPTRRPRPTPAEHAALIDAGLSDGDVAERYGVAVTTARRWRTSAGIEARLAPASGGTKRWTGPQPVAVTVEPESFPTPGKRAGTRTVCDRPFLRLNEMERWVVRRVVDDFFVWLARRAA